MEVLAQQVVNGLVIGATYAVVALGFALIFGVLGIVNMTQPDIFMIAMFVGLAAETVFPGNIAAVVLSTVAGSLLLGLIIERAVLRPLRSPSLLIPLLGTIGATLVLTNAVAAVVGPDPVPFRSIPYVSYAVGSVSVTSLQLANFGAAAVLMLGVSYYVRGTRWGRASRAMAERPEVAAAFGIDINRAAQLTIAVAAVTAGIAGISIANMYGSSWAYVGSLYALKSAICMLVAGNRNLEGVIIIGLLLGVVEALVVGYVSSAWKDPLAFVVLIVVLYVRPNGLFGSYAREVK